jgi:hypothetical protein
MSKIGGVFRRVALLSALGVGGGVGLSLLTSTSSQPPQPAQPAQPRTQPLPNFPATPPVRIVSTLRYPNVGLRLVPTPDQGFLITGVMRNGVGYDAGIQPRTYVTAVNGQPVNSLSREQLDRALTGWSTTVRLTINDPYQQVNPQEYNLPLHNRGEMTLENTIEGFYTPPASRPAQPAPQPQAPVQTSTPTFYLVKPDAVPVYREPAATPENYTGRLLRDSCVTVYPNRAQGEFSRVSIYTSNNLQTSGYIATASLQRMPDRQGFVDCRALPIQ